MVLLIRKRRGNLLEHSILPLGIGYLTAVFRNKWEVKIVDGEVLE